MGTRNLVMVVIDGQTKVAQYGQFDGYPSGVGVGLLNILRDEKTVNDLKSNLKKARFVDEEGVDKEFIESYNKNVPEWSNQPDNRTPEQLAWFKTFIARELSEDVLINISNFEGEEILLRNNENFAKDSLFCEWAYVVDFDKNSLEVFKGFNQAKPSEGNRFGTEKIKEDYEYYPCVLKHEWSLSDVPDREQFLAVLESTGEEV